MQHGGSCKLATRRMLQHQPAQARHNSVYHAASAANLQRWSQQIFEDPPGPPFESQLKCPSSNAQQDPCITLTHLPVFKVRSLKFRVLSKLRVAVQPTKNGRPADMAHVDHCCSKTATYSPYISAETPACMLRSRHMLKHAPGPWHGQVQATGQSC